MAFQVLPATALANLTSVAANAAKNVASWTAPLSAGNAYVTGTFVATYDVEVSGDGTNFAAAHTGKTVPGVWALPAGAIFARIRVTAYTSGTVASHLAGCTRLQ